MTKIILNEVEYETVDTEKSLVSSLEFLWLFIELTDNTAYTEARLKRTPMRVVLDNLVTSFQKNQNLYFGDLVSGLCAKGQAEEFGDKLRSFIPSLPPNNDPLFLTQAAFAYILGLAQEGAAVLNSKQEENAVVEPQSGKKPRKKKGFGEKATEAPTLEDLTGREVSPDEIVAAKEDAKLISISDDKLAQVRPDLQTLDEQDYEAALAEQKANWLTVVSAPAPPDADQLEDAL